MRCPFALRSAQQLHQMKRAIHTIVAGLANAGFDPLVGRRLFNFTFGRGWERFLLFGSSRITSWPGASTTAGFGRRSFR